jgi:hypothetical protein
MLYNVNEIPPRPLDLRVGLAIHWALCKHDMPVSDGDRKRLKMPVEGLARTLQREFGHVGLKLVWEDGSALFDSGHHADAAASTGL